MAEEQAESLTGSPGARLQVARTQAGLSLAQAAERLHLPENALEAIETGRFEGLGASVYVRAHLRRYAELVGIPEAEILASYDAWSGRLAAQPDLRQIITAPAVRSGTRRLQLHPRQAVIGAIVVVLLGVVWWAVHKTPKVVTAVTPGTVTPAPAPAVASAPASAAAAAAAPAVEAGDTVPVKAVALERAARATAPTGAPGATTTPMAAVSADEPMQLTLKFSTASWADIYDANGKKLFHGLARGGTRHSVSGSAPLRVFIGNPPAVTMEMNGQPLAWNSAHGASKPRRFTLDKAGNAVEAPSAQP